MLGKIISFAVGAAIGSAVTYILINKKFETRFRHEVDSAMEEIAKRKIDSKKSEEEIKEYHETIVEYTNKESEDDDMPKKNRVYVISPEEFGKNDYDAESLNYYADGVLTNSWDEVIEDVDGFVGEDSLTRFGEYEDDCVYVRNEVLQTDYEILLDERKFSDIVNEDLED